MIQKYRSKLLIGSNAITAEIRRNANCMKVDKTTSLSQGQFSNTRETKSNS